MCIAYYLRESEREREESVWVREGEGVRVRVCVSDESFNLNLHANGFFSLSNSRLEATTPLSVTKSLSL